jgi:ADP-ribosyl-[dinitrogen reductase] hydrolase
MMIELAIGDAYGACFNSVEPAIVAATNDATSYRERGTHQRITEGHYGQHTQMSLAIAEAVLSKEKWTPKFLAGKFVEVFKRNPREYASRFYESLRSAKNGADFLARVPRDGDDSGAAIRAVPIGLHHDVREVIRRSTMQAKLTHDTENGTSAAVAAALLVHYFSRDVGPKKEAGQFIASHVEGKWDVPWEGKVGPKGPMSVRAAITAVIRAKTLRGLLKDCIAFTGNVSSVAAIALGAASMREGMEDNLHRHLHLYLEGEIYGSPYLEKLDRELMANSGIYEDPDLAESNDYGDHM